LPLDVVTGFAVAGQALLGDIDLVQGAQHAVHLNVNRAAFGRRGANGVQPYCRPCNTLNVADWLKRPGNRERHNANIVASKQRTPERTAARKVVSNALAAGRMVRGACVVGSECAGQVQAHHDDYNQPLDVRWLCRKHHEALHHTEAAA
jgi:hypothetical protein